MAWRGVAWYTCRHLLQPLQSIPELSGYLMPIIHGFISTITSPLGVGGVSIDVALISRRHVRRAGTRFNRSVNTYTNQPRAVLPPL